VRLFENRPLPVNGSNYDVIYNTLTPEISFNILWLKKYSLLKNFINLDALLLISVHPKTPNFGFTLSAVSIQLSAKVF